MVERFSMSALAEKLSAIGGEGKFSVREWRIKRALNWHDKAPSAIRHMLHGERRPDPIEAKQIEGAHLIKCAEDINENTKANARLLASMREAIGAMQATDPDFFAPHLEAVRELLFQGRDMGGKEGDVK